MIKGGIIMAELKIPYVIQEQRRKRNMTQEELAAALGVTVRVQVGAGRIPRYYHAPPHRQLF